MTDPVQNPTPRTYKDRLGRPITDPAANEARFVLEKLRRGITIGMKAGRPWDQAVTVGELAKATALPAARVVEIVRSYDVWLWAVTENEGPIEQWWVFEDGE